MFVFDGVISQWLFNFQDSIGIGFLVRILGVYTLWVMVAILIWLLFNEKSRRKKVYVLGFSFLLVLVSRGIITEIIRFFYKKQRPFSIFDITPLSQGITSASFPSGHTVIMFSMVLSILLLGNKKWTWVVFILASLGAIARVMMGIHWLSDIIGGVILAGTIFLVFYFWLLPPSFARQKEDKIEILNDR